jgi:endonuclease/exonuclease/phosphatase (EEP) superfamily protein YafD
MRIDWSLLVRLAALFGVLAVAVALTFGFMGRIHPAFDSFSHFRIHLAAVLLIAILPLAALRYWPEAAFAALLGMGAIWATIGAFSDESARKADMIVDLDARSMPVFRLMHLNLRYDNETPERVLSAIGEHRPDIVTLTEVSDVWAERLAVLDAAYPHRIICPPPTRIGGVAILSRRPFVSDPTDACGDRGSFANVEIDFAGRRASVVAMHLGWPWPFGQSWHLSRIEDDLPNLSDSAILAGDFNAVPWSQTVRRVAELGGLRIVRGIGPTYLDRRLPDGWRRWVGLPIDQIMAKGGVVVGTARALPAVGSDHLPVLVEFSLLPREPEADVLQAMRK